MNSISLTPLLAPVQARVEIPGSKSYSNRALVMAAMVEGVVRIEKPLVSDDTDAMISCLETLGIHIEKEKDALVVHGGTFNGNDVTIDANLSGTTLRFLTALCSVIPGTQILTGGEGLCKRPIKDLVEGLQSAGAQIEHLGASGCPPLKISSISLSDKHIQMNGGVSSQYFSALLMIAPFVDGLEIEVIGEQISKPYIDMTIDTMREFGVEVKNENYKKYSVAAGQAYKKEKYTVEGDYSAAGYFAAIAKLAGGSIVLENLNLESKQGDKKFIEMLEKMGPEIKAGEYDMNDCPDQAQTMAVLLAFAEGKSVLTGVRSLRVKETERVKALEAELAKMGIKTESTHDTLTIYGGNPRAATIDTYGDHRMAMSFAVAGSKLSGMKINDPEVVNKTFPEFWEKLRSIGVQVV